MNPNTSNLDPTARSFNAHHYTQTQNQGNVYPIGSSLTGMGNIQTGLQPPLGARTAFGGMSTTSSQPGDRFPAGFNQVCHPERFSIYLSLAIESIPTSTVSSSWSKLEQLCEQSRCQKSVWQPIGIAGSKS